MEREEQFREMLLKRSLFLSPNCLDALDFFLKKTLFEPNWPHMLGEDLTCSPVAMNFNWNFAWAWNTKFKGIIVALQILFLFILLILLTHSKALYKLALGLTILALNNSYSSCLQGGSSIFFLFSTILDIPKHCPRSRILSALILFPTPHPHCIIVNLFVSYIKH